MPDPQTQGSTPSSSSPSLQDGLTQFLTAKSKGDESGNYRRNAKRVITRWIDWFDQRNIDTFEQLDETVLAHYAEYLRRRVAAKESEITNGGIARSTALTYYNTISAFLGWASKWGYIQENYARAGLAQESMPERSASQQTEQQFWTPEQREQILNYVNKRAHDAKVEARDRALVAVLVSTGVRGSEIFRSEHDNRTGRQGLQWSDVDLEEQTISVLGKNQQRQSAWLLEQAIPAVERYRTISNLPTDEWPVFPTRHAPSLYESARSHLREVEGKDKESIEALLKEGSIDEILREYQITPSVITTTGARSVMNDSVRRQISMFSLHQRDLAIYSFTGPVVGLAIHSIEWIVERLRTCSGTRALKPRKTTICIST